jgi:hypothetical protein
MRNPLIAVMVGAIVAGAIAYGVWGMRVSELQTTVTGLRTEVETGQRALTAGKEDAAKRLQAAKPRATVITLEKADPTKPQDKTCKAKIEDEHIRGTQEKKVAWMIEQHPTNPCNPGLVWGVELDFDEVNGTRPFKKNPLGLGQDGDIVKIENTKKKTTETYPYKIMMHVGLNKPYPMADPDLEVEPPPSLNVPPANPPAPAPSGPPAKKQ